MNQPDDPGPDPVPDWLDPVKRAKDPSLRGEIYSPEAEDGRTDWPTMIVKGTGLLLVLAAVGVLVAYCAPVKAAIGDPAIQCRTESDMARIARMADPAAQITIYRGAAEKAFLAALIELSPHAPSVDDISSHTVAIGTYVSSDPTQLVLVRFFGPDGCDFFGISGPPDALRSTLMKMGTGA